MKFIVTARSARISSGVLILSKDQAEVRAHNLKALGKGRFEIIDTVEFKNGEEIGYEGDLPKALAENMTEKAESESKTKKEKAEAESRLKQEAAEKAKTEMVEMAKIEWDKNELLRTEFADDFESYLVWLEK